jgi:hypothetical protein
MPDDCFPLTLVLRGKFYEYQSILPRQFVPPCSSNRPQNQQRRHRQVDRREQRYNVGVTGGVNIMTIDIPEDVLERLQQLSEQEHRSVDSLLREMLQYYMNYAPTLRPPTKEQNEALLAMRGMLDIEDTDLSVTVRETMKEYYKRKYGDSA